MHVGAQPRRPGEPGATSLVRLWHIFLAAHPVSNLWRIYRQFYLVSSPSVFYVVRSFCDDVPAEDYFPIMGRPLVAAVLSATAINFWLRVILPLNFPPTPVSCWCFVRCVAKARCIAQHRNTCIDSCIVMTLLLHYVYCVPPFRTTLLHMRCLLWARAQRSQSEAQRGRAAACHGMGVVEVRCGWGVKDAGAHAVAPEPFNSAMPAHTRARRCPAKTP